MNKYLLLLAILAVSGCASVDLAGPVYDQAASSSPPIEPGKSRLVIYRPARGGSLTGANAYVDVSGIQSLSIVFGAFAIQDVPSGKHEITVNGFATSRCRATIEVAPSEVTFLEIVPRPQMNPGWLVLGPLGAIAGSAVEAAGKECGGDFEVRKVDADHARIRLSTVRKNPN